MDVTREQLAGALRRMGQIGIKGTEQSCGNGYGEIQYPDAVASCILGLLGDAEVVNADIPDPEVAAIAAIVAVMDALDEETVLLGTDVHERVIRWAMARYLGPVTP